jgi:hypothetical protein
MSIRAYRWTIGILLCVTALLGWRWSIIFGQVVTADFIDKECKITDDSFRAFPFPTTRDLAGPAQDLEFLISYYEARSNSLVGSHLEQIVRRDYEGALSNALAVFRRETTNDLGNDPRVWIQKYGK